MTDIGELVVRIKADAAQLEREMAKAGGAVKQQSGEMEHALGSLKEQFRELIPAITVAAALEFAKSALEAADRINDLAQRTGVAGETLSALNIPLKQSGSNLEEFSASISRMNNLIGEAAKGVSKEAIQAFDDLGLSVKTLQGLSPEEQFYAIAEALGEMDNQGKQTNAGMAIFGRSFASLLPIIKESKGHIRELTEEIQRNGDSLTKAELDRIDEWGDKWTYAIERSKLAVVDYLNYFYELGEAHRRFFDDMGLPKGASYTSDAHSNKDVAAKFRESFEAKTGIKLNNPDAAKSAKGSNAALLAAFDKDNEVAPADYDTSALMKYINDLQGEAEAMKTSKDALEVRKALIEASTKAQQDYDKGLRDTALLYPDEVKGIKEAVSSLETLKQAQQDNEKITRHMMESLSEGLADAIVNFKSLRDIGTSAIQDIAKEIIKAKITNPLSKSIIDGLGSEGGLFSGIGHLLGFASGGSPPVGIPSIVGENGPELFVPNTTGTIIPNGKFGGPQVTVVQHINVAPGVPELINQRIQEAAPRIAAMGHASVFQALQNGGAEARMIGSRN